MQERRFRLIELAIQGGATIDNATKVASDWERWATEDDPLRLGVPPPILDAPTPMPTIEERRALLSPQLEAIIRSANPDRAVYFKNSSGKCFEIGRSEGPIGPFDDILMQLPIELLSDATWMEFDPKNPSNTEPTCNGNCGINYCDENGCVDKKEVIGSPHINQTTDWQITAP